MTTGMLRPAQPAASCGIPRRQSTYSSRMLLPRAGDQGMHAPPEPTRISSEKVKPQGTRSQGAHSGTTGAASTNVTCENVARRTLPAAAKAISVKEREGGFDTDRYSFCFLLTPFPTSQTRSWPRGQRTEPTSSAAPAGEHGDVTRSPARLTVQNPLHQSGSALKTAGMHDPQEYHTPGHQVAGPPLQHTRSPGVRAHNTRACYISGQAVEGRPTPGHRITEHLWQRRQQGAQ